MTPKPDIGVAAAAGACCPRRPLTYPGHAFDEQWLNLHQRLVHVPSCGETVDQAALTALRGRAGGAPQAPAGGRAALALESPLPARPRGPAGGGTLHGGTSLQAAALGTALQAAALGTALQAAALGTASASRLGTAAPECDEDSRGASGEATPTAATAAAPAATAAAPAATAAAQAATAAAPAATAAALADVCEEDCEAVCEEARADPGEATRETHGMAVSCRIPGFQNMVGRIAAATFCPFVRLDVDGVDIHPAAKVAMGMLPLWPWFLEMPAAGSCHHSFARVHVYTDGSFICRADGSKGIGWAVVLLVEAGDGALAFAGHFRAGRSLDRGLIDASGVADNNTAERLAIAWATLWAIANVPTAAVHIHSDSQIALSEAQYGPTIQGDSPLAQVVAGLNTALRARNEVVYFHVHSHEWQPWNELADSLAKSAALTDFLPDMPSLQQILDLGPSEAIVVDHVAWLFLTMLPADRARAYPTVQGDALVTPIAVGSRRPEALLRPAHAPRRHGNGSTTQRIGLASHNVLTLDYSNLVEIAEGLMVPRKLAALQAQYVDRHIDIIGVQEGRSPRNTSFITKHYVCLVAAAKAGQGGCQLWISRNGRIACGLQHVNVLVADARLLIVAVACRGFQATCVVFHAPHSQRPQEEIQAFWTRFGLLVHPLSARGHCIILLGDANGTVGTVTSEAVGPHFPEKENLTGSMFHSELQALHLWCPATFRHTAAADCGHTWRSADGHTQHRIDYVAVPRQWQDRRCSAAAAYDFDTLMDVHDHVPSLLYVTWTSDFWCDFPRRRQKICDAQVMKEPAAAAQFVSALARVPAVGLDVSVHDHLAIVTAHVRRAAAEAFPVAPQPTQAYIAPGTWQLIQDRRMLRKQALGDHLAQRRALGRLAFACWQGDAAQAQQTRNAIAAAAIDRAAAAQLLKATTPQLRALLKADKANHTQAVQTEIEAAAERNDPKAMFKSIKKLRKFVPRPLPAIALADGTLADCPQAVIHRWREFTHQLHHADLVEPHAVVEILDQCTKAFIHVERQADQIPTLHELTTVYRKAVAGRAFGEDGLPPELFKAFAPALADAYHPLTTKASLALTEPVQWRGGMLTFFPKPKGDVSSCSAHREIVISEVAGKAYHKCRRRRILPFFVRKARQSQMGGIARRAVDFGSLALRLLMERHRDARRSYAVIFVDIVAAFYNLEQKFLAPSREALRSGHPVAVENVVRDLGVSEHLAASIATSYSASWYTLQHDESYSKYTKGLLPGDPEVDLLFTTVITLALDEIQLQFEEHGIGIDDVAGAMLGPAFTAHLQQEHPIPADVSYVDDSAFVLACAANDLASVTGRACCIVKSVFLKYGLPMNFAAGKSEVVLGLHGADARRVWREIMTDGGGRIHHDAFGTHVDIIVSALYKHLGSMIAANGSMAAEVSARIAATWATVKSLCAQFYKAAEVSSGVKAKTVAPFLWSRLCYNAATWSPLTAGQFKRLNGVYLKCIHLAANTAKEDYQDPLINSKVLAKTSMVPLSLFLRLGRLALLPRLLRVAPPYLLRLCDESRTRRHVVVEDLTWLGQHTNKFQDMPDPAYMITPWLDVCRLHPGAWKAVLRQVRAAIADSLAHAERDAPQPPAPLPVAFHCYECGLAFARLHAYKMHCRIAHGARAPQWDAVHGGTACLCCLKEFHTVDRLLTHFRGRPQCYDRIVLNVPPEDEGSADLVEDLRRKARVCRSDLKRGKPATPHCQLPGPLPRWAV